MTGAGGGGGGVVGGVVGGLPSAPPPPPAPVRAREPVIDYQAPLSPAAQAQELGELFEYKLRQPITVRKNESALVPILNAEVDAERVSVWNRGQGSGRPLRGVWLTNSSALTLDGGSFSVVDANAFAGEGLLESVKPGEKRLLSYGADLAVLVKMEPGPYSGRVVKIVARDGVLISSQEERAVWKYTARNEDTAARTLIVEHAVRPGWTMAEQPAVAEMSPTAARYRLSLPAKQEATLTVTYDLTAPKPTLKPITLLAEDRPYVDFTVTFGEPVVGVSASDFVLKKTGVSAAIIARSLVSPGV